MKHVLIIFSVLFLTSCSKQKTVFICGDHVCVNRTEAKQYFEENLSLEVKILNKDKNEKIDLVELNLNNSNKNRKISINKKNETKKKLRLLSDKETKKIKLKVKKKKLNDKKETKNVSLKEKSLSQKNVKKNNNIRKSKIKKKDSSKPEITDVCLIIEKCNINEISKFLIKQGNKKKYPDITRRQ